MAGKPNTTYKATMIAKYGSEEAWKDHLRAIGSRGGKNGTGHQWGHGKVDPSECGRIGGKISKRKPKVV